MSQNRNNSRRRGRSNRGQGGGNQGNRIDSRARGNAPQLLEKYKKLAHDASLNGDRVQTEYYLQFADHYFRVIADNKAQKEEQQRSRQNERDDDDSSDDDNEDDRQSRGDRGSQRGRRGKRDDRDDEGDRGQEGDEASSEQGDENPFVRDSKPRRGRPRKKSDDNEAGGLDPSSLPPAIGKDDGDSDGEEEKPRRRSRSRRPGGDEEALEAHG